MKEIAWWFGSNEIHFVHQLFRSLILLLPLHNQLTLWDPLTWFKLICILLGDLGSGCICTGISMYHSRKRLCCCNS